MKEKIIEFDFFNENINILNCIFHYCISSNNNIIDEDNNFNKLFEFISNILNQCILEKINSKENIKGKNKVKKKPLHKYIYNHIGYVLRKINIEDKANGKNNILYKTGTYALKLINEILPILLSYYSFDEFKDKTTMKKKIKLKFNTNSLVINLAKNPYLNFEQKYQIFNSLNEKLKKHFDEDTDEDVIYLYKFIKLYIDEQLGDFFTNITTLFKKYKFIRKIFADNFFIGKLYRAIYNLTKKYDCFNTNNYINNLSKFLNKDKQLLSHYKISYLMNDNYISIILLIIINFEEKNLNSGLEEKLIKLNNKNDAKFKKLYKQFVLSDIKLFLFAAKDIIYKLQNANFKIRTELHSDFLDLFFSFEYYFDSFESTNFTQYFTLKDKIGYNLYQKKLKERLSFIKGESDKFSIYKYILKYSPYINNNFIFNDTITKFKILMKKYFYQLIFKWNEDCDFSELQNLIIEDILPFCKLFLDRKDSYEDRKNKINFFFDEFIPVLLKKIDVEKVNPQFKEEEYQQYKQLALDYLNINEDSDHEFFYNLDYKIYFPLMLIFIHLKFGKFNPYILSLYISKYKYQNNVFLLFLRAYFNNDNKNDIPYHFFLLDNESYLSFPEQYRFKYERTNNYLNYSIYHEKETFLNYILFNSPKLKHIDFSLIFDYINSIINVKTEYDNETNNNLLYSFKYIFSGISLEQNSKIFNKMNDMIFSKNIIKSFYSFLDIDPILLSEENLKHKIKILKQISINIENEIKNTEDIFDEKVNENTFENISKILKILQKEKDSLFNFVKNNRFLLKISLHYLLNNYYFYIIQKTEKNSFYLSPENENCKILKKEIYNFLDFYEINCKQNNEYIIDFSQIFFSLCQYHDFIYYLKIYIKQNILSCKIQILNNYGSVDISFFKNILEKDLLILLLYYMYIIKEKKLDKNTNKKDVNNKSDKKNNELKKADIHSNKNNIYYYFNINKDEISFILNNYSDMFINENIKQIYNKYLPIFCNLESQHFETEKDIDYFGEKESNNIYLTVVFIYIKQIYPSYNPSLLYYIYNKFYAIDSKKFFHCFMNCVNDKENQNNMHIHLFLEKDEKIIDNDNNNINIKNICEDLYNKKLLIKNYIVKHLLNVNYSKSSFFFEYIDKKIEKALVKKNLNKIDYIIYYYTQDKNKDIYDKFYNKFIQSKIPFYLFLNFDCNIIKEQNMINIITLLENLSKNNSQNSEIHEEEEPKFNIVYNKPINRLKIPKGKKEKIKTKNRKEKRKKKNEVEFLTKRKILMKNEKQKREKLKNKLSNKFDNIINKIKNLIIFFFFITIHLKFYI